MSARTVAEAFFGRMAAGDVDAILRMTTPDATASLVPLNLRGAMTDVGARYLRALARSFPDLVVRVRRLFIATGDIAVAEINIDGTQADDFLAVINQYKHFDLDQAWMLTVTPSGQIAAASAYWDQNQLYRRLGVKRLDSVTITAE